MALVLWDASALAKDMPVRRDRRWSVCWLVLTPAMVVVSVPTAVVLLLIVVIWPAWQREHIPARLSIMLASASQRDYNSPI